MKCCVFQYERFPSFGRHYYLIFIIVPTNARTHVRTHTHTYTYAHTHTVKTNCKIHPRTGREGPEGVEVQLYSFFDLGARWGWVFNTTPRPFYPRERPGTHCIGSWVAPQGRSGRVWKISPPTGIRSPDRPARSESLYGLSYPSTLYVQYKIILQTLLQVGAIINIQQ